MIRGYRYVKNSEGQIFIITLTNIDCEYKDMLGNLHLYNGSSYYTFDCTIEKIEEADTGKEIQEVTATGEVGLFYIDYWKGKKIHGKTFYVHNRNDLYDYLIEVYQGHHMTKREAEMQRFCNFVNNWRY